MNGTTPTAASPQLLAWIVGLLALPFLSASLLYFAGWRPAGTVNRGTLIQPPIVMDAGIPRGQWSMLLLHDAPCGNACLARLDELRRARITFGRHLGQTGIVWAGNDIARAALTVQTRIPDLVAVDSRLAAIFVGMPAGSLLVVDPAGRAILRYEPGAAIDDIRHDLLHLLPHH